MRTGFAFLSLFIALALPACTKVSHETRPDLAAAPVSDSTITAQDESVGRGEAVAELACASCHAIGAEGESLHAEAPPFRLLYQSIEISSLRKTFAEGRATDHPDMPHWEFDPLDLDGLVAYLETVQTRDAE